MITQQQQHEYAITLFHCSDSKTPARCFRMTGCLRNTNTLVAFKELDKKEQLYDVGKQVGNRYETCFVMCETIKDLDHPEHPCSLVRAIVVHIRPL